MRRIYLDSNILIAHFSTDKAEETKKKMVETALAVFQQLKDVQLCTSLWAITEMVNILVSAKRMDRASVGDIESQLVSERRIQKVEPSHCHSERSEESAFSFLLTTQLHTTPCSLSPSAN